MLYFCVNYSDETRVIWFDTILVCKVALIAGKDNPVYVACL